MELEPVLAAVRACVAGRGDEIAAVYVFGSTARGDATQKSDVDLGILFHQTPASTLHGQPFDLAADLERRLGVPADVVVLNSAPPDLRIRVLREGVLAVEHDRSARIRFEVATRNEYFDLEPILLEYRRPRRSA